MKANLMYHIIGGTDGIKRADAYVNLVSVTMQNSLEFLGNVFQYHDEATTKGCNFLSIAWT